ncbi:hypothetical protein SteCoe_6950 [Stentor coeruleus]|uniref:Uncharacterized protein n=1 Tax=Stentor coeruleus TaxID=5963 RepID=A0A1R2CNS9_9CILI|nr:hypothetical protein SteCoe_6950 [Stentor coeruleus]
MESKLITVEVIPEHPKLLRLPSVSRSLYFSILPKSCYEMYDKPVILTMNPRQQKIAYPPQISESRKKDKRRPASSSCTTRPNIKPCPNSYVYNKMFFPKQEIIPKPPPKRTKSRPQTTQNQRNLTFYCEVNPPRSAPKRSELPKNLNHTLMELGDINYNMKKSPSRNLLINNPNMMIDKEMEIDMKFSQGSIEDLHKISEVQSSMEEERITNIVSLSLFGENR